MIQKITITISTTGAAFEDPSEVPGILHGLAHYFAENGGFPETITDSNGNTCGAVSEE